MHEQWRLFRIPCQAAAGPAKQITGCTGSVLPAAPEYSEALNARAVPAQLCDSTSRHSSESSQPRQASVMLLPYSSLSDLSLPGVNFCAPALRWLSTMTPNTWCEPAMIWAWQCRAPLPVAFRAACCCWRDCSPPSGSLAAWLFQARHRPPRHWPHHNWALCHRAKSRGSPGCR